MQPERPPQLQPKLREVERYPQIRDGAEVVVIRDPLGLAEPFALDSEIAVVLDLLDGSRTIPQIRQSLLMRSGLDLPTDELEAFVDELGDSGLLDDDRFLALWEREHAGFLAADTRAPRFGGLIYPDDPDELRALLADALPDRVRFEADSDVLGVLVPHAPLAQVGTLLDATLQRLPDPRSLDAVVLLGTDHAAGLLPVALTCKAYGSMLGDVTPALDLLEALERRIDWIYREEIRHRDALSLETAALLLKWTYGDRCPPIVPVLCGRNSLTTGSTGELEAFMGALEAVLDGRRVLLWGSAELSHVGPAYGHARLGAAGQHAAADRDRTVLQALVEGRPDRLASRCTDAPPYSRPSGGAVLTMVARLLPVGYRAELAQYARLNVEGALEGAFGVAGVRFRKPTPATSSNDQDNCSVT